MAYGIKLNDILDIRINMNIYLILLQKLASQICFHDKLVVVVCTAAPQAVYLDRKNLFGNNKDHWEQN